MNSSVFSLWIAWRYLFAKKSHNAINILTAISSASIAVGTAALVCVMSVMNGFEGMVSNMFSAFDAQLRIEVRKGKYFSVNDSVLQPIFGLEEVKYVAPTIEETALLSYADRQEPALIKGVDEHFASMTDIESLIIDGSYQVKNNDIEWIVLGAGLQYKLGVVQQLGAPLTIYCPRRTGSINTLRPDQSFNQAGVLLAGAFAIQQTTYDDRYAIVSLDMARDIFEYDSTQVTALELELKEGANEKAVQRKIRDFIGEKYIVSNRYEQQQDFYRIMNIEKWLTFLLMAFILTIAAFSVVGSLTMLRIEKSADSETLTALGATKSILNRIFIFEGWLITLLGAIVGLIIGLIVCALQERYGVITYGSEFMPQAYPVAVKMSDIVITTCFVALLGFVTSCLPTLYNSNKKQP